MSWLKWHIGSSADPKFRVIAKHAKVKISDALAVWLMILEYAWEHDGSIEGLNREIIEAALNMKLEKVNAIFDAMYELELIADTRVAKWEARQAAPEKKEKSARAPMSNAERQRKHRENKQCENTDRNGGVTARNEDVTARNEKCNGNVTRVTADSVTCNESVTEQNVTRNEDVTARNESRNESVTKCNAPLKEKIKIKEEDKEEDLNAFCAEPSCEGFAPEPESPPVISLPLNDKSMFSVFQKNVESWQALYPAVDVEQQLRNMRGWLDANPTRRKTRKGILKFINGWLADKQDKGVPPRASPYPATGSRQPAAPTEFQKNMQERRQMAFALLAKRQEKKQLEDKDAAIDADAVWIAGRVDTGRAALPDESYQGRDCPAF